MNVFSWPRPSLDRMHHDRRLPHCLKLDRQFYCAFMLSLAAPAATKLRAVANPIKPSQPRGMCAVPVCTAAAGLCMPETSGPTTVRRDSGRPSTSSQSER